MKYLFIFTFAFGLLACDQKGSIDSTKERARAQEEASREIEANTLGAKAQKMEADLSKRHFYYNAVEGDYEGIIKIASDEFKIKFTFVRSVPSYTGSRVRELSEIENDLNNLYFHMQVVQWHPLDEASAVGCRVSGLRPNLTNGSMVAATTDCPNLYTIYLSEDGSGALQDMPNKAQIVAEKIYAQEASTVDFLRGTIQPSSNAKKYSFSVKRVK